MLAAAKYTCRLNISRCRRSLHVGTITTPNASKTSLGDVLNRIKPKEPVDAASSGTLLILLTPTYARHAQDSQLAVHIAKRLFGNSWQAERFESVSAVVDGLPAESGRRSVEGISYVLQDAPRGRAIESTSRLRQAAQRPGTLSFAIGITPCKRERWTFQLPLSQTIFSTGLTSTLVHRTHQVQLQTPVSQLIEETNLESLQFNITPDSGIVATNMYVPFVQLTTFKTVASSMGNIVRTLVSASADEEPASKGLEEAVAAYFKALHIPPQPISVWAVIWPSKAQELGAAQDLIPSFADDDSIRAEWAATRQGRSKDCFDGELSQILEHGARIVKVLSGGGGWGKKAGLLSFDPDLEYTTRELRDDWGWQMDFDTPELDTTAATVESEIDRALGRIVDEGDSIAFYTDADVNVESDASNDPYTLTFGMCDKIEYNDIADKTNEVADHSVLSEKRAFGMSSETGMALQMDDSRTVKKSKLEVPGLRFNIRSIPTDG